MMPKRKFLVRLFILIIIGSIGCVVYLNSSQYLFKKAYQKEQEGDFKGAIEYLSKIIRKEQNNLPALMRRGANKSKAGNFQEAIDDYMWALEIDSDNVMAHYTIGLNYWKLDSLKLAEEYLSKAIELIPPFLVLEDGTPSDPFYVYESEIKYERAFLYYEQYNYKLALQDFLFCLKTNYRSGEAAFYIGNIYGIYGMSDEECFYYKKALNLNFEEARIYIQEHCNN